MVGIPEVEAMYSILLEQQKSYHPCTSVREARLSLFASFAAGLHISSSWQCLRGTTLLSRRLIEILTPSLPLRLFING